MNFANGPRTNTVLSYLTSLQVEG